MTGKKTRTIILTALLAALTTVATMVIRIPTPTLGYIHLGDGLVLICGILLGPGLGAVAAGIGSMLADLFAGAVAYMPGTLVIKALTAAAGGWLYHHMAGRGHMNTPVRVALCGIPAECVMVAGYFVYEVGMQAVAGSAVGAAAVQRFDHTDIAEQVVSVLDHIVIEFGAGGVCHSVASYYGFKPL